MKHYDVIIIGGGPAGSTTATLTKRYSPHLDILLLEKAHFPRHHVGESLLAGASPILLEMGVHEQVNQAGFLEKLGATYVWGQDREPWGFEFDAVVSKLVAQGKTLPTLYTRAWQVKRAEYDHILLKHAQNSGVEVKQRARVVHVLRSKDGQRVIGVEYKDENGLLTSVESDWVIDCSGQDALIAHELKYRKYDERMNNYALFGYWKGAKWQHRYVGHPDLTRIFIATTPRGWIWYIPMTQDIVSVGFVTHRQTLKKMPNGPEKLYHEEIAACPEIRGLLDKAHLVHIARDQKKDVCAIQDWSYVSTQIAGPGWAMAGDSAGFVDPILSSGVMLAHELGQKAAYTLNSSFKASSDEQIKSYWDFYANTYRTYIQAYRDMAAFWYSNNFSMESWLWEARRTLMQQNSNVDLSDREAFNRIAAGYATRAESLSLFGSYPLQEAQQLVDGLFGTAADSAALKTTYATRPLQLSQSAELTDGMYFYDGEIRNTKRIINSQNKSYLDLHPAEEVLVRLFDGKHTLDDLEQVSQQLRSMADVMPIRRGIDLVVQLDTIGVLV